MEENDCRMCMSCGNESETNGRRRFNKRRITILSIMGAGAAGIAFFSVTANPALGASVPAILAFAACPAMCAAMGGTMWLRRRFAKKKRGAHLQLSQQEIKEVSHSEQTVKGQQQDKLAVMVPETDGEKMVVYSQPQKQRRKRKVIAENHESVQ